MRTTPSSLNFSGTDAFTITSVANQNTTALGLDVAGTQGMAFSFTTAAQTAGYGAIVFLNGSSKWFEVVAEL
jgi:hypothetical protein